MKDLLKTMTFKKVGARFGISPQRVSQLTKGYQRELPDPECKSFKAPLSDLDAFFEDQPLVKELFLLWNNDINTDLISKKLHLKKKTLYAKVSFYRWKGVDFKYRDQKSFPKNKSIDKTLIGYAYRKKKKEQLAQKQIVLVEGYYQGKSKKELEADYGPLPNNLARQVARYRRIHQLHQIPKRHRQFWDEWEPSFKKKISSSIESIGLIQTSRKFRRSIEQLRNFSEHTKLVIGKAQDPKAPLQNLEKREMIKSQYQNLKIQELAQIEGVSAMTIQNWARRFGWKKAKLNKENILMSNAS